MDALVNELMKELNCDTVFTIPVLGGIPVKESVVVTWIIMAVILVLCIALTRNLSVENPSRGQIILETIVSGGHNFFKDTLGEHGAEYIPYLMTVTLYIGIANLIGLLGFKPPTKDMNVTAALAFMSIVLIEIFIKPLSLCMRLFGNVLGSFVIMELLKLIVPAVLPAVFSCYFDIFDGLIQAYVFVFLTSLFIKEATE